MKDWSVIVFFPEVRPAHLAEQSVIVRASSIRAATGFALDQIRKRTGMKGKRITTARLTVRLVESQ